MNPIKKARWDKGMTQQELAEKIGVSKGTISRWENDKSMPHFDDYFKLQNTLHKWSASKLRDLLWSRQWDIQLKRHENQAEQENE